MKRNITISIDIETVNAFDKICGLVSRSAYINELMKAEVKSKQKV